MKKTVAVIGGGAAGFFTAVNAARMNPDLRVVLFEKGRQVLAKVRVSGGGRCNVTHHCFDPQRLSESYPRGGKFLRWNFEEFSSLDTVAWFSERGVKLKTEKDGRMFPVTDSSETIIECLKEEAKKYGVMVHTQTSVKAITHENTGRFTLNLSKYSDFKTDRVVVATGGFNRESAYNWIKDLGHTIIPPVPSLFTFNFREKIFGDLAGISVENAGIGIEGTGFLESGPVLFTHWGLSGPAVLALSARAARDLKRMEYRFNVAVNWLFPTNAEEVRSELQHLRDSNARKSVDKQDQFPFPNRLWSRFLEISDINREKRWAEISNRDIHMLVKELVKGNYNIQGKTTYKEEFVTCGGVSLKEVHPHTLQSKLVPGLYFVGEVLNIDGVTGGFNFQAAWTNGWLAAKALSEN